MCTADRARGRINSRLLYTDLLSSYNNAAFMCLGITYD